MCFFVSLSSFLECESKDSFTSFLLFYSINNKYRAKQSLVVDIEKRKFKKKTNLLNSNKKEITLAIYRENIK